MKILLALTVYEVGGVSSVARNLLDCFSEDEFDITLLTEKLFHKHYPIINNNIRLINLDISPQKYFFAKVANIICHIISMRRHIIREKPDVILSFGSYMNCHVLLSLLFNSGKRPKIILTEHSQEMFLSIRNKNIRYIFFNTAYRILMFLLYCKADYIVTVSKSIAARIKKIFFVSPYKIRVIYNPVNISKIKELCREKDLLLGFNEALPCIGTVSRLSPEKGINFLIQGFKVLLDKIDAVLIIVGDGAERLRLEQMAKELGIKEKVIFTGLTNNPFKYITKMDVFILPSLWEGFPNVLLEAMVCGVPVIASDSPGGIREAIKNRVNGLLIKPGSSLEIAESAYDLLSNREKRFKIIEEAYKSVKQFNIDIIKKEYKNLMFS